MYIPLLTKGYCLFASGNLKPVRSAIFGLTLSTLDLLQMKQYSPRLPAFLAIQSSGKYVAVVPSNDSRPDGRSHGVCLINSQSCNFAPAIKNEGMLCTVG